MSAHILTQVMYMRGIFMRVSIVIIAICGAFGLSACTRVIENASDELKMYHWACEEENGSQISLSFEDTDARLTVENEAFSMNIEGLCIADDDSFTICDSKSKNNYTFGYQLYGDRVELSFGSGMITLDKLD